MADQDDSIDSRTSAVGRKRPHEASVEPRELSGDGTSVEENYDMPRKRLREHEERDVVVASPGDDGRLKRATTLEMDFVTDPPSTQPLPQRLPSELRSTGWNKGVQSGGIRTSFGMKKQPALSFQPSSADDNAGQALVQPETVQSAIESFQSPLAKQDVEKHSATILSDLGKSGPVGTEASRSVIPEPALQSRAGSSYGSVSAPGDVETTGAIAEEVISDNLDSLTKPFRFSSRPPISNELSSTLQSTADGRPEPPVFETQKPTGKTSSKPQMQGGFVEPKIIPTGPRAKKQPAKNTGNIVQGNPIPVKSASQSSTGLKQNLTKAQKKSAAAQEQNVKVKAIKAVAAAHGMTSDEVQRLVVATRERTDFTKKQMAAYRTLSKEQKATLSTEHVEIFEHEIKQAKEKKEKKKKVEGVPPPTNNSNETIVAPLPTNTSEPIIIDDSPAEDVLEAALSHSGSCDPEDGTESGMNTIAAPSIADILLNLDERELELQLKYFPTDDGRVYVPHCLFCTQVSHATRDCPITSCALCGDASNHSTSSCPKRQRCGKCREIGHSALACPAKLARLRSEAVPCDLCGSSAHIESQCHMIWRSFFPKPEEIKTIRSLPIDCYTCGQDTHLGPECGLYQGPGNVTWSRANFRRYVGESSITNAISVGVDYTIRSQPNTNIKRTANDPIILDSSDDDVQDFIHTKVNASAPKRNIHFGSIQRRPGPRGTEAKESRPAFGDDPYAPVQPARNQGPEIYERERSFSPPPQFDASRSQYPPLKGGQELSNSIQNFSRPPTEPRRRMETRSSSIGGGSSGLPKPSNPARGGPGKRVRKKPKAKKGQGGGK